jgi:1-deoxy-D-xylulose-5-phosphate reductoisomerase
MFFQLYKGKDYLVRSLSILGATGSIGESTLRVLRQHTNRFHLHVATGHQNAFRLAQIAHEFKPKVIAIADSNQYQTLKELTRDLNVTILSGNDGVEEAARHHVDIVLSAITGVAALKPTFIALRHCRVLALANKESIVAAGPLILEEAKLQNTKIIPVDSEHNAIFQVFENDQRAAVDKIILTASGGPFRTLSLEHFASITPEQALKHPNWSMGAKITIDSATLINKALELIEAHHLFQMPENKIDIVIHPQSIIHSLVSYADGSTLAQLGMPDMCTAIAYALGWPTRLRTDVTRLNLEDIAQLTFERVNYQKFPTLNLARECLKAGQSSQVVFNSANEFAVTAFLNKQISFLDIFRLIEESLQNHQPKFLSTIDEVLNLHHEVMQSLRNSYL